MKKLLLFLLLSLAGMTWAQNNPMHGWHTYCTSELADVISYGTHTTVATCYPPDMAIQYAGTQITKVGIFSDDLYNTVGGIYTCSIYLGGETPAGGSIVYTMTVNVPQGLGDWAEFDLSTPIGVTGNETIWIVWQAEQPLTPYHMGVCGDIDPSGNGIWAWNGSQWEQVWLSPGDWTVKTYFNWDDPQPQDIYVSGNHFTTGKVFKNNTLLYSITDSLDIQLKGIQVAEDGTVYGAGYAYNDTVLHGCVWMNDSCIFIADTNTYFDHIALSGNDWTVAGFNNVWQNGELLYSYTHGDDECHINSLAVDTTTGDIYAGGAIYLSGEYLTHASVWKNDSLLWIEDSVSSVYNICFDGENLYLAGYKFENDSLYYGVIWQNDSIIYQMENANFVCIAAFDGSLYWSGISMTDTIVRIWQDGEVLYALPELSGISNLVVNENGVYYTDAQTVYKDGEVLYQPTEWCIITDLVVKPVPPEPTYTITVESDHPEWGSVAGGGTYYYGDTIEISATANIGFEFLGWSDGNTSNPRTVVVTEDQTYIACFGIQQCLITTEVTPEGAGTIDGGGTYDYGTTIRLNANSNIGYTFLRWSDGDLSNPRTVVVEGDATYTAVFEAQQYEITTSWEPAEGGTVTGGGVYPYGEIVTLNAIPNEYYSFLCWNDGVIANPRQVTVTQNASYTALFHQSGTPQYTITVVANDPTLGTVTGSGTYPEGATIEISATPFANAVFDGWDDGNTDNPRNIVVTGDKTFTAQFSLIQRYTIIVKSQDPFTGTVYGGGTYLANETIVIGALPSPGFIFSGWQDGDMNNPRTLIVTGNATYTASFSPEPVQTYTVTVYYDENQGFVIGSGTYLSGSTASIAAIPADDFVFVKWSDDTTDNPKELLVDHDIVLAAFFSHTSIDENDGKSVTIYPNPADDKIRIEGLEGENEIQIYNAMGLLMKTVKIIGNDDISIDELSAGFYVIKVGDNTTMRFIKR